MVTTVRGSVQPLAGTGDVTGATGPVADTGVAGIALACSGTTWDLSFQTNEPATHIWHSTGAGATCTIDSTSVLGVDVWQGQAGGYLVLGYDPATGEADLRAEGALQLQDGAISGSLDVVVPASTPPATVEVDLQIGAPVDNGLERTKLRNSAFTDRYSAYDLSGSVTLPDGTELVIEGCRYTEHRYFERFSFNAGQKPGGKAPANDLPGAARPLASGTTVKASTRGAAEAPEAPCVIDPDGWTNEVPVGRTVWYVFTGTGGDVALDTAGSGFDTVLGVYQGSAHSLVQFACVDDVDDVGASGTEYSLEARLTIPTTSGATYLVQVGGFEATWGTVVLSRR